MKIYKQLANALLAKKNCEESGNKEWVERHSVRIGNIMRNTAPRGSGIDSGTAFRHDSTEELLLFSFSYHHMDEHGSYSRWTDHLVMVKASLWAGIRIFISGGEDEDAEWVDVPAYRTWYLGSTEARDQDLVDDDFLDYLHHVFETWLDSEVPEEVRCPK